MKSDAFRDLSPDQIAAYLTAQGWRLAGSRPYDDRVQIWDCTLHDPPHVTEVALITTTRDYGSFVARWCLPPIAECERRPSPAEQVGRDIVLADKPAVSDRERIRAPADQLRMEALT